MHIRSSLLLIACSLLFVLSAKATIIGSSVDNLDGTFTYSYTVDNTSGAFDIVGWSLEFPLAPGDIDWDQADIFAGGDVTVPSADWIASAGIPTVGNSAQDFFSIAFTGDVLIGQSLSGFGFTSSFAPANATFTLEFGALGESASGQTVGPNLPTGLPDQGSTGLLLIPIFSAMLICRQRLVNR
jgi:hypothetical protein